MKKFFLLIAVLLFSFSVKAQQNIILHNSGNAMYSSPVSAIDSIKFVGEYSKFKISGSTNTLDIRKQVIDSLTFSTNPAALDKIYIIFNGSDNATIINPYAAQGVNIAATGGSVTVAASSGMADLQYHLLGTSAAGSLTMSSTSPATFVLNNLNLTNSGGPAIILTGAQTHTFSLQNATANTLEDGASNTKNGALQSDGKIIFAGTGTLSVKGVAKHAISTSTNVEIQNGSLKVTGAASDGLHSDGFAMSGGTLEIVSSGDGIDAGDGAVNISAGNIKLLQPSRM